MKSFLFEVSSYYYYYYTAFLCLKAQYALLYSTVLKRQIQKKRIQKEFQLNSERQKSGGLIIGLVSLTFAVSNVITSRAGQNNLFLK